MDDPEAEILSSTIFEPHDITPLLKDTINRFQPFVEKHQFFNQNNR